MSYHVCQNKDLALACITTIGQQRFEMSTVGPDKMIIQPQFVPQRVTKLLKEAGLEVGEL